MTTQDDGRPVFGLVDDNVHSARLLSRTLAGGDFPARVIWLGNAGRAQRTLGARLAASGLDMVIVDLKTHSKATEDFISRIAGNCAQAGVRIAAISDDLSGETRNALIGAGAEAVFQRYHDLASYRAEMEMLTSFWVRESRIWSIRA